VELAGIAIIEGAIFLGAVVQGSSGLGFNLTAAPFALGVKGKKSGRVRSFGQSRRTQIFLVEPRLELGFSFDVGRFGFTTTGTKFGYGNTNENDDGTQNRNSSKVFAV